MLPKVAQTTMDGFVECAKTFDILAFEAGGQKKLFCSQVILTFC